MHAARLRASLLSAALVAGVGLTVGTTSSATAASQNVISTTSPDHPMSHETFLLRGRLATAVERPVLLQRKVKSGWKKVTSGSTAATGTFALKTSTTSKRTYRVYAPKVTIGSRTYRSRTTTTRTVQPTAQKARLWTSAKKISVGDDIQATGTFTPARKGRVVYLRLTFKGTTEEVPIGALDAEGKVRWKGTAAASDVGTYTLQMLAVEHDGAARKFGPKASLTIVE